MAQITCPKCQGSGTFGDKDDPACGGSGATPSGGICLKCTGTGKVPKDCFMCGGTGKVTILHRVAIALCQCIGQINLLTQQKVIKILRVLDDGGIASLSSGGSYTAGGTSVLAGRR